MPPAREEADEGRLDGRLPEVQRRDMALQVVDRHERDPARPRDRLGGREPDEQRADQPRSARDPDPVRSPSSTPASSREALSTGAMSSR